MDRRTVRCRWSNRTYSTKTEGSSLLSSPQGKFPAAASSSSSSEMVGLKEWFVGG